MPRFDITIAGELNLDLILYGLPEEIPLERELLATDFRMTLGSSSAILAHNLATLQTNVGFITRLGADDFGKIALGRLEEAGVDISKVTTSPGPTSTGVTILLHHGGPRRILTYPGTMFEMSAKDLDLDYLASSRHFHLSSLFLHKALAPDLPAIFRELKSRGLTLSLDTNDDPEDKWEGVIDQLLDSIDILLPNEDEVCRIAKEDSVDAALEKLSKRIPLIVVKTGSRGSLIREGNRTATVPGIKVAPLDSIGAGDSFNAGFLAAYLKGADPETCARSGNITGALSTLRPGGTEAFREAKLREQFLEENGFYSMIGMSNSR